ncbi:hypothetical protein [Bradyrhizobium sp. Bra78]|uniref:hypothetical protein n=1 Tax=Bradyrhizobium sp. Bra78 TaxID=2926010 RepID=UPI0021C8F6C1|nr:hypothetical protein [Bradyrhizobium sp. Bra78]
MTNWLEAAFGLRDEPEPAAQLPRQAPTVESFWCVVAQPSGAPGDLGETVVCRYIVTEGVLRLCDEHGKGGGRRHILAPGEEPRRIASRMRREVWQRDRTDFDRPLHQGAPRGWC